MLSGFWRSKNWRGGRKGLELDDLSGPANPSHPMTLSSSFYFLAETFYLKYVIWDF